MTHEPTLPEQVAANSTDETQEFVRVLGLQRDAKLLP